MTGCGYSYLSSTSQYSLSPRDKCVQGAVCSDVPFNCMHLEWLGDNQPTIFADTSCVLTEFDLQSLINYCIALKEVFQGCIDPLGCCNFRCCKRVYFVLITAICKQYFIHVKAVGLHWCAGLIVATPMVRKDFHCCALNSSGSTPSIAWMYLLVLLSLGLYSSLKIASTTVL